MSMKVLTAAEHAAANAAGVLQLPNDADIAGLDLAGVERVELNFPKFTDGRAFSQALLLRRRLGFGGDIRATGDVLPDQLVQMQRSGFTSAVLKEGKSLETAKRQLGFYAAFYQGDVQHPAPIFRREPA